MPSARRSGFTLIELLVVIGIISLLAVVLLPDLVGANKSAKVDETRNRLVFLSAAITAFENTAGIYPPDDLRDPKEKALRADNGTNTGIESLVWFLCNQRGGADLSEHLAWLANTDKDENGVAIPRLGRSDRVEITDSWGMPLAYFNHRGSGYARAQKIVPPGEGSAPVDAKAWKNDQGGYLGDGRYQIVSAGPDGEFNTPDDLTWPERN